MKKFFRVLVTALLLLSVFVSCNAELNTDKVYGGQTCEVVLTLKDGSQLTKVIQGTEVPADFLSNYFLQGKGESSLDTIVGVTFKRVTKVAGTTEGATGVGKTSFRDCKYLEKVIFDNSIQTIGAYAFNKADQLKEVKLANVRTIGDKAFYSANEKNNPYTRVELNTANPPVLGVDVFGQADSLLATNVSIAIEDDSKYRTADVWKDMFKDSGLSVINPDAVTIHFVIPLEVRTGTDIFLDYNVVPQEELEVELPIGSQLLGLNEDISASRETNNLWGYDFVGWAYSPSATDLITAENAKEEENLAGFNNENEKTVYAILEPRIVEVTVDGLSSALGEYVMKVQYLGGIDKVTTKDGEDLKAPETKKMPLVNSERPVDMHLKGIFTEDGENIIMVYDPKPEEEPVGWQFVTGSDLYVVLGEESEPIWVYGKDCTIKSVWDAEYEVNFKFNLLSEDAYFVTATDLCCGFPTEWEYDVHNEAINPESETDEAGNVIYTGSYTLGLGWATLPTSTDLIKRDYYQFDGWYKTHIKEDDNHYYDNKITGIKDDDAYNDQLEFFAKWNPVTVEISYYDCDGSTEIKNSASDKFAAKFTEAPKVEYNVYERITDSVSSLPVPVKAGYIFAGWAYGNASNTDLTDKDGKLKPSVPGYTTAERWVVSETDLTREINVYAKWTPVTYTFNFSLEGGNLASGTDLTPSGEGYIATYTFDSADININATENMPAKKGFSFMGWYLEKDPRDGDTPVSEISRDEVLLNLAEATTTTTDLYAVWGTRVYNIEYKDLRSTNVSTSSDLLADSFSGKFYKGSGEDLEIIALGEEGRPSTHKFGESTSVINPTKAGYKFENWTICIPRSEGLYEYFTLDTPTDCKTIISSTEDYGAALENRIYLCATWTPIEYTVYLHGNGGVVSTGTDLSLTSCTDVTYGKVYSFKYTFDTTPTDLPKVDLNATPAVKEVSRDGNTFLGWFRSQGEEVYYKLVNGKPEAAGKIEGIKNDSATVALATGTNLNEIHLYGQWLVNTYNVTLDKNDDGDNTTKFNLKTMSFTYGEEIPSGNKLYEEANPTRTGYTFGGWYFASETDLLTTGEGLLVSGTDVINTSFVKKDSTDSKYKWCYSADDLNVTVKAKWTLTPYTVTIKLDEGAVLDSEIVASGTDLTKWAVSSDGKAATMQRIYSTSTVSATTTEPGSAVKLPVSGKITRPGYTFKGWCVSSTDIEHVTSVAGTVLEDKTFIADWEAGTFKIYLYDGFTEYESEEDRPYQVAIFGKTVDLVSDDTYQNVISTPTRPGYKFKGWYLDTMATFTDLYGNVQTDKLTDYFEYDANSKTYVWNYCDTESIQLYAEWEVEDTLIYINGKGVKASGTDLTFKYYDPSIPGTGLSADKILTYVNGTDYTNMTYGSGSNSYNAFAVKYTEESATMYWVFAKDDADKWTINGAEIEASGSDPIEGLPLVYDSGKYRLDLITPDNTKILFVNSTLAKGDKVSELVKYTNSDYPQFANTTWNLPNFGTSGNYYHSGWVSCEVKVSGDVIATVTDITSVDQFTDYDPSAKVNGKPLYVSSTDLEGDPIVLYAVWREMDEYYDGDYEEGYYPYSSGGNIHLWYVYNSLDAKSTPGYRKESLNTSTPYDVYPGVPSGKTGYTFTGYRLRRIFSSKTKGIYLGSSDLNMIMAKDYTVGASLSEYYGGETVVSGTSLTVVPAGSTIYVTNNIGSSCVFVENWEPNTYTIVLDPGLNQAIRDEVTLVGTKQKVVSYDVTIPASETDLKVNAKTIKATYGKNIELPAVSPYEREGYVFVKWVATYSNDSKTGMKYDVPTGGSANWALTMDDDFSNDVEADGDNAEKNYIIKNNPYSYLSGETIFVSNDSGKNINLNTTKGSIVKLTAVWAKAEFTVSLSSNGATKADGYKEKSTDSTGVYSYTVKLGDKYKLPTAGEYQFNNYHLEGWYLPVDKEEALSGTVLKAGYKALYKPNGAELIDETTGEAMYGMKLTSDTVVTIRHSHTIIPQWYNIEFHDIKELGEKGIIEKRFALGGLAYGDLPGEESLTKPSDTDLQFVGWYKVVDSTEKGAIQLYDIKQSAIKDAASKAVYGIPVTAKTTVGGKSNNIGEFVTLYAQWGYKVTEVYDIASDSDLKKETIVPYGATYAFGSRPTTMTTTKNYQSDWWYVAVTSTDITPTDLYTAEGTATDLKGRKCNAEDLIINGEKTFYAQWGSKLTLNNADGSTFQATKLYRYGETLELPDGCSSYKIGDSGSYTKCDPAMGKAATLTAVANE